MKETLTKWELWLIKAYQHLLILISIQDISNGGRGL